VVTAYTYPRPRSARRIGKARYQKEKSNIEYQLKFEADILDAEQGGQAG
jgi:hypothetical protein